MKKRILWVLMLAVVLCLGTVLTVHAEDPAMIFTVTVDAGGEELELEVPAEDLFAVSYSSSEKVYKFASTKSSFTVDGVTYNLSDVLELKFPGVRYNLEGTFTSSTVPKLRKLDFGTTEYCRLNTTFKNIPTLKEINLQGVKYFWTSKSNGVFNGTGIEELYLNGALEEIDLKDSTFKDMASLKKIVLGGNLKTIKGGNAFNTSPIPLVILEEGISAPMYNMFLYKASGRYTDIPMVIHVLGDVDDEPYEFVSGSIGGSFGEVVIYSDRPITDNTGYGKIIVKSHNEASHEACVAKDENGNGVIRDACLVCGGKVADDQIAVATDGYSARLSGWHGLRASFVGNETNLAAYDVSLNLVVTANGKTITKSAFANGAWAEGFEHGDNGEFAAVVRYTQDEEGDVSALLDADVDVKVVMKTADKTIEIHANFNDENNGTKDAPVTLRDVYILIANDETYPANFQAYIDRIKAILGIAA